MRDLQESHYAGLLGLIRLTPKIIMYLPILLISYYINIIIQGVPRRKTSMDYSRNSATIKSATNLLILNGTLRMSI